MKRCMLICIMLVLTGANTRADVDPKRVDAIATMLSDNVFAFGPRISNRDAWNKLAHQSELHGQIAKATLLISKPLPPLTDDLFLEFSRTGNRQNYEAAYFDRTERLTPLVIAECIEHHGRFIPALENLIAAIDEQKLWMLPAHDPQLENFRGHATNIDLFSSELACELANASYILGDSLSPHTREQIDQNVRRRVLDPFREMVIGSRKPNWWITANNNWNAVCLANVLGAALAALPDKHDRALFRRRGRAGFNPLPRWIRFRRLLRRRPRILELRLRQLHAPVRIAVPDHQWPSRLF